MSHRYAVVGNPVAHSLSPVIHQYFAQQTNTNLTYEKIKAEEHSFEAQVTDFFIQGGKGLNITLPFKQRAFAMAQHHTARCQLAGAANTLWMKENQLHADNTDGIGFIRDVTRYLPLQGKRVLILGAGGATRGIIPPLLEQHLAKLVIANRTLTKAQELQHLFPQINCMGLDKITDEFDLVIHATSATWSGESITLPDTCLLKKPLCYDLSYRQHEATAFVSDSQKAGCAAVDGLGMLVEQAAEAFFIWHGVMPEVSELMRLLREESL